MKTWTPNDPRLPSRAQVARLRKRVQKAHDALDDASYMLLEAMRVYDGDKIPTSFPHSMAWEDAKSVEDAIGALARLLAGAEDYCDQALGIGIYAKPAPPEGP